MNSSWTYKEMEQNFYLYISRIGESDALYDLRSLSPVSSECKNIKNELLSNLITVLEAVTTPVHVGSFTASMSIIKLIDDLLINAKEQNCIQNFSVAQFLMTNNVFSKGIQSLIPSFEKIKNDGLLTEQYENLYKLTLIRFYGCLEEMSKQTLKAIILTNVNYLDDLEERQFKIGRSSPKKLKRLLNQSQDDDSLNIEESYDENILNKGFKIESYSDIFKTLTEFNPIEECMNDLKELEEVRNLLVHRNSKIDKQFIKETKSNNSLGDLIKITPQDMYKYQDALVSYCSLLISSTDKLLSNTIKI